MTALPKIGVSGPFTGPRAAYGTLLRGAAEASPLAATLIYGDDKATVAVALDVANTFVAAGVDAVVGHFNSDCARAAGQIYHAAGIPFLMPAATAPDLIDVTRGYRICASDDAQIAALSTWLQLRDQRLTEVWQDGSPYAARLAAALQAQGLVGANTPDKTGPIAILGAHHAVAAEITRRGPIPGPVFVPDDCAIAEFADLIAGTQAHILCPVAVPAYDACVRIAFDRLRAAMLRTVPLAEALANDPSFANGQYIDAGFDLREHRALIRPLQEHVQ